MQYGPEPNYELSNMPNFDGLEDIKNFVFQQSPTPSGILIQIQRRWRCL